MSSGGATLTPRRLRGGLVLLAIPLLALCVSMLAFVAPARVQLMVAGIIILAAVLYFLRWKTALTIAMMPVFMIPPKFGLIFAYEVLIAVTALGLVYVGWKYRSTWLLRVTWLEVVVLAMCVWGATTYFWVRDWWWWFFGVRNYLVGFVALWVSWRMVRFVDPEMMLVGVSAGSCALGAAVIVQATRAGWFQQVASDHLRRAATEMGWGAANFLAALMALMLPTGIHMAMTGSTPRRRILGMATIPMTAILVTLASSRGGAVMVVVIAVFAIFRSKIRPWMAILTCVALLSLLLLGPGASLLLDRFTSPEEMGSVMIRLLYFREAWRRIVDNWPFGIGLGQGWGYPDRLSADDPHNYWLVVGSEMGLIGLLLWATIVVMLWVRISKIERDPDTVMEGRALQLTFVISQLNLMFEPTFQGLQYHALFFWIMGSYFGLVDTKRRNRQLTSAPAPAAESAATPAHLPA